MRGVAGGAGTIYWLKGALQGGAGEKGQVMAKGELCGKLLEEQDKLMIEGGR